MRMNKKLKNVLAFGLATSFVLTSTMGVSATGDAVSSYDAVTDTVAEVQDEDVTIGVIVNFLDEDTGAMVMDATSGLPKTWKTSFTFKPGVTDSWADISGVEIPAGYEAVTTPGLVQVWNGVGDNTVTVNVRQVKAPVVEDETVDVVVNFRDVDTDTYVMEEDGTTQKTWNTTYTFKLGATEAEMDLSGVKVPDGYELADSETLVRTVYSGVTNYPTVEVKKVKEPVVEDEIVDVVVNFRDVDTDTYVMEEDGTTQKTWNTTYTFKLGATEAEMDLSGVKVPDGYELADSETLVRTVYSGVTNYPTVEVKKVKEPVAEDEIVDVVVNFRDVDTDTYVMEEDGTTQKTWNTTYTFKLGATEAVMDLSGVKVPDGYELADSETLVRTVYAGVTNYPTVEVKKVKEPVAEDEIVDVVVNFRDVDTDTYVMEEDGTTQKTWNTTYTFKLGATEAVMDLSGVKVPDGYELADSETLVRTVYAGVTNYPTVEVKKVNEVKKTVKVVFTVDPTKGEFPGYDGSTSIHYTIDEDSEEQYLVPEVKAADGYKFVGWQVEGKESGHWDADAKTFGVTGLANYPEGSNEGYLSIDAIFEAVETEPEVKKTVKVVFSVDPAKGEFPGYDGATTIHYTIDEDSAEQYLVPEVKAADGYKFVGWQVEGKESGRWDADAKTFGVTGLANYPEGSNEGYLSIDAIFEAVETETEVQKTVKVVFSVDPAKGEFPGYDGATTIHYTIDEDSAEQYLVPEVKAADGYKFVGWQVEGKESGRWDADAKTFGVTGLGFYEKGSNEGYLSIDAIFEAVETETEVQKTVKVVFSVDPAKGEFPGYDGATTIHYTIDEDSAEQYLVPEVKAADGYKFVGWQVEGKESGRWDADAKTFGVTGLGFYEKGSNEGYLSIDAIFEAVETETEVQKTVKVVFSVDPAKGEFPGYDGATTIHYTIDEDSAEQYLVPEVKAADGYKFVGWQVEGKESGRWDADAKTFGVTGLGFYEEGSNEGYLSIDAIFEAVETEAPVTEPTTEPSTTPATEPSTEPTTEPSTTPATEPTTEPSTTPATEPSTTPATEPSTEPTTEPSTEPTTEPSTTPVTEPSTEPTTEPSTEPATEAPTSESETKVTESETQTTEAPATTKSDDNNSNKSADAGVKTGDTTNVMPLVITLFAAVALMVVFALRKRKVVK